MALNSLNSLATGSAGPRQAAGWAALLCCGLDRLANVPPPVLTHFHSYSGAWVSTDGWRLVEAVHLLGTFQRGMTSAVNQNSMEQTEWQSKYV